MSAVIDTDAFSVEMRARGVNLPTRRLRITNLTGSEQEGDLTKPSNCGGFGRIRHFRIHTSPGWPPNPLPVIPAARALDRGVPEILEAQVFQNAVCNWRCWYCFVDFELLSGRADRSSMLTADQIVQLYLAEDRPAAVIDLSGGQPDLVPEWVPWMMRALEDAGLADKVYLWSDDNLSNDYFWRHLSAADRDLVSSYAMYGKVCCFKGFDAESFAFNTQAAPELFDRQFELMARLVADTAIDLYAYATFTGPRTERVDDAVTDFVDRLQKIDENLPLRLVPLEIAAFTPVRSRGLDQARILSMDVQRQAIEVFNREIERRFDGRSRRREICDVPLERR